jgi:hypothetical protein
MMALTRLGWPPYRSTDIFDFACRLYPNWSSHSLENVAAQLKSARVAEDRALPDARLVKDVFFDRLRRPPTVKKISEQACLSPPLTFADAKEGSCPLTLIHALKLGIPYDWTLAICEGNSYRSGEGGPVLHGN